MARPWRTRRIHVLIALSFTLTLLWTGSGVVAQPSFERRAVSSRQAELLERTVGQLKTAPRGSRPQIYFVGFAGFGGQAVFKREVLAVRQLFDERFDTRTRSVALINHPSTADEIPLASVGNLESVLQHVGKLMDPRRDTLFLLLSSHGERGMVAVEMPGLALNQLRPAPLKRMLDQSGIRRRVIVVSSCHSGSFIPALADESTLVIAASRADRSSFGCEDRRQWTYFGDAYFNRALREEHSFKRAFVRASQLIAEWEGRDRLIPSLPQIAGGEALTDLD
jgi:hypothetical protein